jgi:TolA-binding protein
MKRQERHHLKENELATSLASARAFYDQRADQLRMIVIGVIVVLVIALVVVVVRQRSAGDSERLLAEAIVALNARVVPTSDPEAAELPEAALLGATGSFRTEGAKLNAAVPKLRTAADAYPDKPAGIAARYHLAGALAALGKNEEAAKEFEVVVQKAGNTSFYGRMARLGQAESLARSGQLDAAIQSWQSLKESKDEDLPADAILISLARAYAAKGQTDEARKTFTELVDSHPDSPYFSDARAELSKLKG